MWPPILQLCYTFSAEAFLHLMFIYFGLKIVQSVVCAVGTFTGLERFKEIFSLNLMFLVPYDI